MGQTAGPITNQAPQASSVKPARPVRPRLSRSIPLKINNPATTPTAPGATYSSACARDQCQDPSALARYPNSGPIKGTIPPQAAVSMANKPTRPRPLGRPMILDLTRGVVTETAVSPSAECPWRRGRCKAHAIVPPPFILRKDDHDHTAS